ncbi:MAG: DUF721 domain-containing protein [Candidatus Eremiobacteraeota bacterium]|nr:DUF721 domain-containing protein [Candidatus Eremiobacteraeota bacterium]
MLRRLRSAVEQWAPSTGRRDRIDYILCAWPAIVGEDVALHCRPLQLSGNTLLVATRSSAWSQQLDFLAPSILSAIGEYAGVNRIERLRFRVAPLKAAVVIGRRQGVPIPAPTAATAVRSPSDTQTAADALRLLRESSLQAQRAKRDAGWKECLNCRVLLPVRDVSLCAPCAGAAWEKRYGRVARLMFDAPWLGYEGTAKLIEGLTPQEFGAIRKRLLRDWWEFLMRAQRRAQVSPDGRERLVASSYVLLKTGFEPEEITTAIVRNLLGSELHELLYGNR